MDNFNDFTSEELSGILPNPDLDLLDITKDENKEIAESRFAKPVSEVKIKAKIGK